MQMDRYPVPGTSRAGEDVAKVSLEQNLLPSLPVPLTHLGRNSDRVWLKQETPLLLEHPSSCRQILKMHATVLLPKFLIPKGSQEISSLYISITEKADSIFPAPLAIILTSSPYTSDAQSPVYCLAEPPPSPHPYGYRWALKVQCPSLRENDSLVHVVSPVLVPRVSKPVNRQLVLGAIASPFLSSSSTKPTAVPWAVLQQGNAWPSAARGCHITDGDRCSSLGLTLWSLPSLFFWRPIGLETKPPGSSWAVLARKHPGLSLPRWVAKFNCQFPCHVMVCNRPAHLVS